MNQVIIETEKLQHNIDIVKEKIKNVAVSENRDIPLVIAVLKGNGYGMDSLLLARKMIDNGISFFAVSTIDEAKVLRDNGYNNDVLLLQSTEVYSDIEEILELNLIPTVGSKLAIERLNEVAVKKSKKINAHLKIDTGFSRFGFIASDNIVDEIIDAFKNISNINITGTYSHFSESYSNDSKNTKEQFEKFMRVIEELEKRNFNTGIHHICNSPAFFKYPYMYLDAVRIGSAFTGRVQITETTGLQKVGYLKSTVSTIKKLPKGSKIGYSRTEKIKKDTDIAIVEAGYADGIGVSGKKDSIRFLDKLRTVKNLIASFKNGGRPIVTINGEKCRVLGRIGMKNLIADITGKNIQVGDKVKIDVNLVFVDSNIKRQETN